MEQISGLLLLSFIFRVIGAIVCYSQAKSLNRDGGGWAIFGFFLPLIAMIWVFCSKPIPYKNEGVNADLKPFTRYYTENGVIEVENGGERKVYINDMPAPNGKYELNRIESIEVFEGKIKSLLKDYERLNKLKL